ncbi:hypothetical protein ACCAA_340052 [Candidatus Accumulibacter aalborgensis]|uniref:Uncharacterized protein n=1 Tax=Candidatus Accumulibacter aalborgensis TaxID=1860102 RepID=A0A1A8XQ26_9PROT|nr:hypothetical protein ACCAA_340052 [Candidatus Accumulibacter aalborgensis]
MSRICARAKFCRPFPCRRVRRLRRDRESRGLEIPNEGLPDLTVPPCSHSLLIGQSSRLIRMGQVASVGFAEAAFNEYYRPGRDGEEVSRKQS